MCVAEVLCLSAVHKCDADVLTASVAFLQIDLWRLARRSPPPAWLALGVSQLLLLALGANVLKTLKWLYPTQPQRADEWLVGEIKRYPE
jgi:hypothetical protein